MTEVVATIVVTVRPELVEIVADRMWQWGVRGVSETDTPDGSVEVTTSVGNEPTAIERALATLDPSWSAVVREVRHEIAQVAPEFLSPTRYSRTGVSVPASLAPLAFDDDPLVTVIDPGSAFGLGDHPTTQTSMALLQRHLHSHRCSSLLDVGCGSGVLAVLAAQMGVESIRAVDIADAAVEATLRNMELNGVTRRIDVDTTDVADLSGAYDVIMANILAPTLVSMADDLKRLLGIDGTLIISGILAARHDHVLDALRPLRRVDSLQMGDWITIALQH